MQIKQNDAAISITGLEKIYSNGFQALNNINLQIPRGEIFALLGPNGAGKTTLINTICGIVQPTKGKISVFGYDNLTQYRKARAAVGLVPQELTTDAFETVWNTVSFSRGLFGKAKNPLYIEDLLKRLSLWDKKDEQVRFLSGGMKRRVMVAKALSHEPEILFLDEPTAGVDVKLRKSMWTQVRKLRETGITIILTTHYIEEAQEMADHVGIINKGHLILTEEKNVLMKKMGKRKMIFLLREPLKMIPSELKGYPLTIAEDDHHKLILTYDANAENGISEVSNRSKVSDGSGISDISDISNVSDVSDISNILDKLKSNGIRPKDIYSYQSSLEEIFINLLGTK